MRYLTVGLPGIGGQVRREPEDFEVEEIPLYPASGVGRHTYFVVEKKGVSTFHAADLVARALGVSVRQIGYAGMKDAHALSRQTFSVEGVPLERVLALRLQGIRIVSATRHRNKLKIGHLRGNRFRIRIRGVGLEAAEQCRAILAVLQARGMPNYFGVQRFGLREDTHVLGRLLVTGDCEGLLRRFLGSPHPGESSGAQEARRLFDRGLWEEALKAFPGGMWEERAVLEALIRSGGSYEKACLRISKPLKRLLVSAFQSRLFNQVLDRRLENLDRICTGDLAMKHENGACFLVEDGAMEQPRADRFEISPTGPLFGYKVRLAEGEPGRLEREVLAQEGLTLEDFRVGGGLSPRGARRPLRVPLEGVEMASDEEGLVLRFALPPGSYATVLLGEVMKCPLD